MYNWFQNYGMRLAYILGYEVDDRTYLIMEKFLNTFLKRYQYKGFKPEMEEFYGHRNLLDMYLFFAPCVAWFEHEKLGLMYLPVSGLTKYNACGKPTEWRVFSVNGSINKELNEKNSVLMFNDEACSIPYLHLLYEARYLTKLDEAMNQNLDLQSTPYIIEAYEENKKTAQTWSKLLSSFKSRIVLRKSRDEKTKSIAENSQVLNTNVELKINELMKAYNEFLFRGHTYMGIKNVNIEKSERLLTGEISANDILVQENYTNCLEMRQKGFDEIAKKFGQKITVEPTDLRTMFADISSAYMAQGKGVFGNVLQSNGNATKDNIK